MITQGLGKTLVVLSLIAMQKANVDKIIARDDELRPLDEVSDPCPSLIERPFNGAGASLIMCHVLVEHLPFESHPGRVPQPSLQAGATAVRAPQPRGCVDAHFVVLSPTRAVGK